MQILRIALALALAVSAQAGMVDVVTTHTAWTGGYVFTSPYAPADPYFYQLTLQQGNLSVSTSFTVHLDSAETFSGKAGYDAGSRAVPNAAANVYVSAQTAPLLSLIPTGNGVIGWTPWSFTAAADGDYTFTYQVVGPGTKQAYGLFAPVPEPSTWMAGVLAGLALVPAFFRRGRQPGRAA
jgi:hypothetical protein